MSLMFHKRLVHFFGMLKKERYLNKIPIFTFTIFLPRLTYFERPNQMCPKLIYRRPNGSKIFLGYDTYYQYRCRYYLRSEENLRIVQKYFIANFDCNNKCTYCGRSFYSYLVKTSFLNKTFHMDV